MEKPVARRIIARMNWLAENVNAVRHQALKGDLAGLYKLRVGDYRIIHEILHDEESIVIHTIGHRREIYRKR